MTRERKISLIEWGIIAAIAIADIILSQKMGIPVEASNNSIAALAIIIALWPLTALLTRGLHFAPGADVIPENAAKFFCFITAASAWEYYMATSQLPLNDDIIISFDHMFGFDWPSFYAYVQEHHYFKKFLMICYFGLIYEAAIVLFVTSIFFPKRANRFPTALIISGVLIVPFLWFFPVAGPFAHYNHTDLPVASYTEHYRQLRSHELMAIPMDSLRGIISFPSFHVSSAVIMSYFLRRIRILFPLSIVFNAGMCVGALVIGGHYLSDVLSGIVVGLITIALLSVVQGKESRKYFSIRKRKAT